MFVWARIPGGRMDSMNFCMELMEKAGVIVTPGASFGPHGEGYVRFALVLPPEKYGKQLRPYAEAGSLTENKAKSRCISGLSEIQRLFFI